MFWINIPAGLALLVILIYLINALINKIVDKIEEHRSFTKSEKVKNAAAVYDMIRAIPKDERGNALQDRIVRKRYKYAVSLWGEPD